jgi:hypothetical protein
LIQVNDAFYDPAKALPLRSESSTGSAVFAPCEGTP